MPVMQCDMLARRRFWQILPNNVSWQADTPYQHSSTSWVLIWGCVLYSMAYYMRSFTVDWHKLDDNMKLTCDGDLCNGLTVSIRRCILSNTCSNENWWCSHRGLSKVHFTFARWKVRCSCSHCVDWAFVACWRCCCYNTTAEDIASWCPTYWWNDLGTIETDTACVLNDVWFSCCASRDIHWWRQWCYIITCIIR